MILITGATGNNGVEIIKRLTARRERIRAMVRCKSGQVDTTAGMQPEFVEADFEDEKSLREVLKGVQRAFLVTNSSERVEEQQLRFVGLAREAGVRHVVYLSQLHANPTSPLRFLRYHAVVEEAIRHSGMGYTMLRPNLYMQGLLTTGHTIASEGKFLAPAGDARVSIVDVRDIAAVAVAALTQRQHEGKTYDLTGPEALSHAAIASQLATVLERPVRFVDVAEDDFLAALRSFHMPPWQAEGLVEDYAHYRRGEAAAVSSAVLDVTGAAPRSFYDFAGDYRAAFLRTEVEASATLA